MDGHQPHKELWDTASGPPGPWELYGTVTMAVTDVNAMEAKREIPPEKEHQWEPDRSTSEPRAPPAGEGDN